MLEIFAVNFSISQRISVKEKYAYIAKTKSMVGLFNNVSAGAYPELCHLLDRDHGKRILNTTYQDDGWVMIWGQSAYPEKLNQLEHPPFVLYGKGEPFTENSPLLSVVGTRSPTPYGIRITNQMVGTLVKSGMGIISGMARGIDKKAHQCTIDNNGYTVVVLGHGLDHTYPSENKKLKEEILEKKGTLLTEYPWGTKPRPHFFRDRNRINAALSDGILVVEANEKSGTKITVHEGLLLNKEIYSIPGPIDSQVSSFTNRLILEGAKMVTKPSNILEDFSLEDTEASRGHESFCISKDNLEKTVLSYFDVDIPKSVEGLFENTSFCLPEIIEKVSSFELEGILQQRRDGRFILSKKYT